MPPLTRERLKLLLIVPLAAALLAAVLFLSAGHWYLPCFWAYVASYALLATIGFCTIDVDLLRERIRSNRRDRTPLVVAAKLLTWTHLVLAGLDAGRFGWSKGFPGALHWVGLAGFVSGFGLVIWAMAENRFFIPIVRIQHERGHHLIASGPYRYVRHPGYAGVVVGILCSGLALGSWLSILPMALLVVAILIRAAREDRFLLENLDGYREYAERTRFRLVPFAW